MGRISETSELISAALRQGIDLSDSEADMMEGHDYCLMADTAGMTVRHDEQYGDNHRGDEPYSIQAAIEFCQEMNQDLLRDNTSRTESDDGYLNQLRKDEQTFVALMERVIFWEVC